MDWWQLMIGDHLSKALHLSSRFARGAGRLYHHWMGWASPLCIWETPPLLGLIWQRTRKSNTTCSFLRPLLVVTLLLPNGPREGKQASQAIASGRKELGADLKNPKKRQYDIIQASPSLKTKRGEERERERVARVFFFFFFNCWMWVAASFYLLVGQIRG